MKQSVFYIERGAGPHRPKCVSSINRIDRLDFVLLQRELTVTHRLDDERAIRSALDVQRHTTTIKGRALG